MKLVNFMLTSAINMLQQPLAGGDNISTVCLAIDTIPVCNANIKIYTASHIDV